MPDRGGVLESVLAPTRWAGWTRAAIAGDASARRYFRLSNGAQTTIVMDAPPNICTDTGQFVMIAEILRDHGFSAPAIHHCDLASGFIVLSDLGTTDFAAHLRANPSDEDILYSAATDLLISLQDLPPPSGLIHLTPQHGAKMLDVLGAFYVQGNIKNLQEALEENLSRFAPDADTLALRDFHAENLIWRPDHTGHERVGLLDFQDAFVAPAGYDLVSLLRDARRDVSPQCAEAMIARFLAASDKSEDAMRSQLAVLGVQRNLRILGVFAKLAKLSGKTRYLQFMDRVWGHVLTDLADVALSDLRNAVLDTVPPPKDAHLKRIIR